MRPLVSDFSLCLTFIFTSPHLRESRRQRVRVSKKNFAKMSRIFSVKLFYIFKRMNLIADATHCVCPFHYRKRKYAKFRKLLDSLTQFKRYVSSILWPQEGRSSIDGYAKLCGSSSPSLLFEECDSIQIRGCNVHGKEFRRLVHWDARSNFQNFVLPVIFDIASWIGDTTVPWHRNGWMRWFQYSVAWNFKSYRDEAVAVRTPKCSLSWSRLGVIPFHRFRIDQLKCGWSHAEWAGGLYG